MDPLRELYNIIVEIPETIGRELTTTGKWTIWIPITIVLMVCMIVFAICFGIVLILNALTKNFFPKLYTKLYPLLKGILYKERKSYKGGKPYPFTDDKF